MKSLTRSLLAGLVLTGSGIVSAGCGAPRQSVVVESPVAPAPTVFGGVFDRSGAVVPGVEVILRDSATGVAVTVVSDRNGDFSIRNVESGKYALTARLPGFSPVTFENVDVGGDDLRFVFTLAPPIGPPTIVQPPDPSAPRIPTPRIEPPPPPPPLPCGPFPV